MVLLLASGGGSFVEVIVAKAALLVAVEVWVSGHSCRGLVQEPPRLPVVTPSPWATFGAVAGARAALRFSVADLPLRLGRAEGGTCVREAAPRPSPRHSGDWWVGASLEPAALHCTLGVREASPLGRDQLSAPSSLSSSLFVLATRSQGLGHKVSATGVRSCKGS